MQHDNAVQREASFFQTTLCLTVIAGLLNACASSGSDYSNSGSSRPSTPRGNIVLPKITTTETKTPETAIGKEKTDKEKEKPETQFTPTPITKEDPNSIVPIGSKTYDLRRGTPDQKGPQYALVFGPYSHTYDKSFQHAGKSTSFTVAQPYSEDILNAWKQGWTGKDINILVDHGQLNDQRPYVAMVETSATAPGAKLYAFDKDSIVNKTGTQLSLASSPVFKVINIGLASSNLQLSTQLWAQSQLEEAKKNLQSGIDKGVSPTLRKILEEHLKQAQQNLNNISNEIQQNVDRVTKTASISNDAIIVKAAGGGGFNRYYVAQDKTTTALLADQGIATRLLIIGTTKENANHIPGKDPNIQKRFLVAPTGYLDVIRIDGTQARPSYASEGAVSVVSGFAAILRQKFPNINAEQTASILLDTARYDTLACSKNGGTCNPEIYGQGEASLSRALSPVGRLR